MSRLRLDGRVMRLRNQELLEMARNMGHTPEDAERHLNVATPARWWWQTKKEDEIIKKAEADAKKNAPERNYYAYLSGVLMSEIKKLCKDK